MNMPFQLPDPSVQSRITHPGTGEVWVYLDGVWQIEEPTSGITSPPPTPAPSGDLEAEITALRAEIAALQTDIINLKAELQSASLNHFLILE